MLSVHICTWRCRACRLRRACRLASSYYTKLLFLATTYKKRENISFADTAAPPAWSEALDYYCTVSVSNSKSPLLSSRRPQESQSCSVVVCTQSVSSSYVRTISLTIISMTSASVRGLIIFRVACIIVSVRSNPFCFRMDRACTRVASYGTNIYTTCTYVCTENSHEISYK